MPLCHRKWNSRPLRECCMFNSKLSLFLHFLFKQFSCKIHGFKIFVLDLTDTISLWICYSKFLKSIPRQHSILYFPTSWLLLIDCRLLTLCSLGLFSNFLARQLGNWKRYLFIVSEKVISPIRAQLYFAMFHFIF